MTKDQIVVGRGGRDYWTDLKLETLPDVSREHFRLRRDPDTGKFFLKDLSRLGTTINGEKAPSSIEFVDGEKRDRNVEAPVPDQARIGLADVVFLEFRSGIQWLRPGSSARAPATRAACAATTKTRSTSTPIAASSWWSTASAARLPAKRPRRSRWTACARVWSARPAPPSSASAKPSRWPTTKSCAPPRGNPEWEGMACVLTVVVLDNGSAVVGHVGDSRLYRDSRRRDPQDHARPFAGRASARTPAS